MEFFLISQPSSQSQFHLSLIGKKFMNKEPPNTVIEVIFPLFSITSALYFLGYVKFYKTLLVIAMKHSKIVKIAQILTQSL